MSGDAVRDRLAARAAAARAVAEELGLEVEALTLKGSRIRHQLDVVETEVAALRNERWRACREASTAERALEELSRPITASDHAVVRYLERVLGMGDLVERARREILSEDVLEAVDGLGDGLYGRAVVRDRKVVTILD